jgi:hypothetical protein
MGLRIREVETMYYINMSPVKVKRYLDTIIEDYNMVSKRRDAHRCAKAYYIYIYIYTYIHTFLHL